MGRYRLIEDQPAKAELLGSRDIKGRRVHFSVRWAAPLCSMKITEDARKFAAEQGIAEGEALAKGIAAKSKEFAASGSEVYAKA